MSTEQPFPHASENGVHFKNHVIKTTSAMSSVKHLIVKADFQSVLRSLSALMFVSLSNNRGKSMLFVTNCLPLQL